MEENTDVKIKLLEICEKLNDAEIHLKNVQNSLSDYLNIKPELIDDKISELLESTRQIKGEIKGITIPKISE